MTTTLVEPGSNVIALRPRRSIGITRTDVVLLAASALSSLCLVWIVFYELTAFSGAAGFVISWIVAFLAIYYTANRQVLGSVVAADRVVAALVSLGAIAVVTPLVLVIGFLFTRGYHLLSAHFFTTDMASANETVAKSGGISAAIIGSLEQVGIATLIGAPAGVATAIYLNEIRGPGTKVIRTVITAMSALPSIVAGLFIYTAIVITFHTGFAGIYGALALAIMLLPNITRTTEEVLKVVHGSLREAGMALGAPDWRTVWSVVLPTARTGIVTAVLLGIARVVGETAPLLVTVGENQYNNANPFSGPQESLPTYVFGEKGLSLAADVERAFGAGLALVILVLVLFIAARIIASIPPGSIGRLRDRLFKEKAPA